MDDAAASGISVDTAATRAATATIDAWRRGRGTRGSVDPTSEYFMHVLECPSAIVASNQSAVQLAARDSTCNLGGR
jgi:uncharacterized protein (DUF2345 family)